ncbi:MAG TPA: hypothetical protein VMU51_35445 [Mycobacteriales bacterium]|nr:hypothetical protein [Mycobacteriales bacterium]
MTDPDPPPALPQIRDLTDEEYEQTYATGTGGHELAPDTLAALVPDDPGDRP